MRACFYRIAQPITPPNVGIPFQVGLSQAAESTVDGHLGNFSLTGNKGNMIHRMAAVQSIDVERARSGQINLVRLHAKLGTSKFRAVIERNFDVLIITMSNALRKGPSDGMLLPFLKALPDIPLYVFGLGMQSDLPNGLKDLDEDMREVALLLNERATFLGVRGHRTKGWMHEAGLTKAVPVGCPSMFVYPLNIAGLQAPQNPVKYMTAGYVGKKFVSDKYDRMGVLFRAFEGRDCSYVFQAHLELLPELNGRIGIYNEATNTIDAAAVRAALKNETGLDAPFTRYYSFNDVSAWRQAAMHHDVFIGDRIHGSVAAMQAGVPAIVLYADARVAELTEYHGIPACHVSEFGKLGVDEAIARYLNEDAIRKFKDRYKTTLVKYRNEVKAVGLNLANDLEVTEAIDRLQSK